MFLLLCLSWATRLHTLDRAQDRLVLACSCGDGRLVFLSDGGSLRRAAGRSLGSRDTQRQTLINCTFGAHSHSKTISPAVAAFLLRLHRVSVPPIISQVKTKVHRGSQSTERAARKTAKYYHPHPIDLRYAYAVAGR